MIRVLVLGILLTVLVPLQVVQALSTVIEEPAEFPFNRSVAVKHAIAALEDFIVLSMPQMSMDAFDIQKPKIAGVQTKSCEGKDQKLILVGFPGKQAKDWAYAHLVRNKDGLIVEMIEMGFTIQTWSDLVKVARSPRQFCE